MIFVSYRRQDSSYIAVTLKERIERRFGVDSVFFDIDNIPIGADFRKHIEAAVSQCQALLVVIGDKWLARVERTGTNRLFDGEVETLLHELSRGHVEGDEVESEVR